jgi:hypothetical protein
MSTGKSASTFCRIFNEGRRSMRRDFGISRNHALHDLIESSTPRYIQPLLNDGQ